MKTKRFLSIVLTLAMLLGMFPGMSLTASAADSTTEITPSNTSGTLTITLTIAAAQAEELLTTITATGKEQASYSKDGVATVSFSYTAGGSSSYLANWGWWGYGWSATVAPANGYTITKCVFYDDANRKATDSEAPFVVETTEEDKTPRINGTPIDGGNFQSKGLKKIEVYGYAMPASSYSVTITPGDNMTKTTDSGAASQTDLTGAMADVVYTADNGYYFPTDYSVAEVSGIKVTRDSYTQITVSGTPTADAAIALTAPTAKTDQTAPTGLSATKASSSTATDGKISGVTATMEYQIDGATTWTAVGENQTEITGLTSGTYKVRYAGTADKNASDATSVEVGVKEDQTAPTGLTATKASSSTATDGKISGVTAAMEYQIDGATTWTAVGENKTEITGLTTETYRVRYAETADKNASPVSTVEVGVKEDQTAPTGLTATKASSSTATDGKISGVNDAMEYQIDGATTWTAVEENKTEITGLTAGTYKVRYAGTADKNASDATSVEVGVKEDQTAPTGLTATKASSSTATDGKISGVNDAMEYQIDGATTWTAVEENKTEITGLTAGTYKVRYAGTADKNASDATSVEVGVKEDQTAPTGLTATKASSSTATDGKISGVNDAMEYQIDGATTWTAVGENQTEITGLTAGTYKVRYAGTADKNASDATSVEVGVKVAPTVTVPTAKTLTYNGQAQGLVNAGSTEDGTLYYAVTTENLAPTDESLYTTSIPTATNVGTYYVWYKVKGDDNHNDTAAAKIETKINPVDKTELIKSIHEAEQYYNNIKEKKDYEAIASVLQKAIKEAQTVAGNDNVDESRVGSAVTTITKAKTDAVAEVKKVDDKKAAEAAEAKEAADTAAAKAVSDKIVSLPAADKVTTADKATIEAARKAYEALTADQKKKVSSDTLKKLETAEKALADAEKKDAEDTAASGKVSEAINALPASDKVTVADKAAIEAARKAYDALSADQKAKISAEMVKKLEDAESALAAAVEKSVKTVTVNAKTVNAKSVKAAVAKAGGSSKYVKTVVIGKNAKKISKGAFKNYKSANTLVVKSKKLKRSTVKKSLKGSKITKVKIKVGSKKTNKKYVKKYKKIFTKKIVGKKVKVSL